MFLLISHIVLFCSVILTHGRDRLFSLKFCQHFQTTKSSVDLFSLSFIFSREQAYSRTTRPTIREASFIEESSCKRKEASTRDTSAILAAAYVRQQAAKVAAKTDCANGRTAGCHSGCTSRIPRWLHSFFSSPALLRPELVCHLSRCHAAKLLV